MSRISSKGTERGRGERNYKVYALNFHGSGLAAIRNEFIHVVNSGLRRPVFIIDLEEEERQLAIAARDEARPSKVGGGGGGKADAKKKRTSIQPRPKDLATIAQMAIERCRKRYDAITQAIENERRFDLLNYWIANMQSAPSPPPPPPPPGKAKENADPKTAKAGDKTAAKGGDKTAAKGGDKTATKGGGGKTAPRVVAVWSGVCPEVKYQEHNKIGAPEKFARIKYIVDEPPNAKLFILLTGNLSEQLYRDLISRGEPLQVLIDFLPEKCAYDYLLPHPENDAILERIIQERQEWILARRKLALFKGAGILQQSLPTISKCLAQKLSKEIYAEMCWCIYDAELLFQQYQLYYFKPFRLCNVAMEASVKIGQLLEVAESLSMQGHYLSAPVPSVDTESTTVLLYLSGLLNTVGPPENLMSPLETLLLSRPSSAASLSFRTATQYDQLVEDNETAFSSIMKIKKYDRIFTEDNNRALCSLVAFTKHEAFYNIYLTCLEYNLLRTYLISSYIHGAAPYRPYTDDGSEPIYLPPYAKLYSTEDSLKQRLVQLLDEFVDHQVDEFYPGYKLYTFRRTYNEVFEDARLILLPSRLCFRDFTLFQKDEFLEDLVTPAERYRRSQVRLSQTGEGGGSTKRYSLDFDTNIFIRPHSLTAKRLQSLIDLKVNVPNGGRVSKGDKRRTLLFDHKSEVKRPTRQSDYVGLPPGHRLLDGYNLEDIRQEIYVKTSKYYFEEGMLQLYEERWCFDDTNKYLEMLVNGNKLTFCAPRHTLRGMLRNIRMITKNDVSVRIYGVQEECARVVINYPNGLVVYYTDLYAEQVWCNESGPPSEELRRIYSPFGAVIVYYKDDEMILVMRYNGEVFRLYQHEAPMAEEEEMESNLDLPRDSKVTFKDLNMPTVGPIANKSKTSKSEDTGSTTTTKKRKSSVKTKSSATDRPSQDGPEKTSSYLNMPSRGSKDYLADSVEYELKFLLKVCNEYALHYINLIVTTSTGRNIHISHKGSIFEADILENIEWHDYWANESYSMRGDGVKLLWTKDSLKCFHTDGTILITRTEEGIDSGEFFDEFDSQISESSSHNPLTDDNNIERDSSTISIFVNNLNLMEPKRGGLSKESLTEKARLSQTIAKPSYKDFLIPAGEVEGEIIKEEDTSYVTYCCDKFQMLHRQYAEVQLFLLKNYNNEIKLLIEINAADGVCVQVIKDETYEEELLNAMEIQGEKFVNAGDRLTDHLGKQRPSNQNAAKPNTAAASARAGSRFGGGSTAHTIAGGGDANTARPLDPNMGNARPMRYIVKLWISTELELRVSEEECEIGAILQRNDETLGKMSDKLELKLHFNASINTTFQEFVSSISLFKNYTGRLSDDQYFIERCLSDCSFQGFEFFEKLPKMAVYNFAASNSINEFVVLPNIDEKFANIYAWYDVDMWKFPRIRDRRKRPRPPIDTFPMVLSSKVYCKIPSLLRNTEEIHKFIDPFETYNFKKNRHQIKETLDFYMRPQIQIMLKHRVSAMSWRRRIREHKRRLAIEQQRKSLYYAMLKHKVYPQYFQFVSEFHGHVKYIDFFDFMRYKCEERPTVLKEVKLQIAAEASKTMQSTDAATEPNNFFKTKRRCPRYSTNKN